MNFVEAVVSCFKNYFDFKKRASLSEYWYFTLFVVILSFLTLLIDVFVLNIPIENQGPLNGFFFLATLIPSLSVTTRRLHDIDRTGWWQLLYFTIIGIVVILYWACKKGDEGQNRFGYSPFDPRR